MNNIQTAERIKKICLDKDILISKMLEDNNLRKSLVYDIEKRNIKPSIEVIEKIAAYLEISIDYLIGLTTDPKPLSKINSSNIINGSVNGVGIIGGNNTGTMNISNNSGDSRPLSEEEIELLRIYKGLGLRKRLKLLNTAIALDDENKTLEE